MIKMDKFKYYFSTQDKIDNVLRYEINKTTINTIIFHLIWNAYYNLFTDEDEIIQYVDNWMASRANEYHLAVYAPYIKKSIKTVQKLPWRNIIGNIPIRKSELDYIASFDNIRKEKVLFCYLAVAKFNDALRDNKVHWENETDSVIFKMARVNIPSNERDFFINDLIYKDQCRIYMNNMDTSTSKRIDFVSDDENDPVVLELRENNYRELGFTYLNWKNGGYAECKNCGRLFKKKKNNQQYCFICIPKSEYRPEYKGNGGGIFEDAPKKITCIDCGKDVFLDSYKSARTCRCEECQAERDDNLNRIASRERMRAYRKRIKET